MAEQLQGAGVPAGHARLGLDDVRVGSPSGSPAAAIGLEEALAAASLHARGVRRRALAGEMRDASVAEVQQVLGGEGASRTIVDREARRRAPLPPRLTSGFSRRSSAAVSRSVEVDADGDHRVDALAGEEEVEDAVAVLPGTDPVVERQVVTGA